MAGRSVKKPGGLCTQLYRCPQCGDEMFQPPRSVVEHYCSLKERHVELKPVD